MANVDFEIENGVLTKYLGNSSCVVIPAGVTSIENSAFEDCSGLTSVTIPDSVTEIGYGAFWVCSGLTSIHFQGTREQWENVDKGDEWDEDTGDYVVHCSDGDYEVEDCEDLEIEDGVLVEYFGDGGDVVIPNGVTSIGEFAFANHSELTSVTIPDSVTEIYDLAFRNCSGLTSISIPESVTSIEGCPFDYCSGLTSIEVDAGNPTYRSENNCLIEKETKTLVLGCKTSVIPSDGSVTSIGAFAFAGCSGLTSMTIFAGVTSIEDDAFEDCSGLTSVTISDSVTRIGDRAFVRCTGLKSIIFQGTREQWKNVNKGDDWDEKTGGYVIRCTDGEFTKK